PRMRYEPRDMLPARRLPGPSRRPPPLRSRGQERTAAAIGPVLGGAPARIVGEPPRPPVAPAAALPAWRALISPRSGATRWYPRPCRAEGWLRPGGESPGRGRTLAHPVASSRPEGAGRRAPVGAVPRPARGPFSALRRLRRARTCPRRWPRTP